MNRSLHGRLSQALALSLAFAATALPAWAQTAAPSSSPGPSATSAGERPSERAGAAAPPAAPPAGLTVPGVPGLGLSGALRAYDFNRENVPLGHGSNPNRIAFNFGGDVRLEYKLQRLPLTIGTAYWGADPLGLNGNNTILKNTTKNGGLDNTLPSFGLSTFEYYLRYSGSYGNAAIGDQLLNKLWAPASDSRIKPALYQALDVTGKVTPEIAVGLTRVIRFESRTDSLFDRNTLLTSTPAGASGLKTVPTAGLLRISGAYSAADARLTGTVELNTFYDIANLIYAEAKFSPLPKSTSKPYLAAQYAYESQTGAQVLGTIRNSTIGVQLGVTPFKGLLATVGFDESPWNYADFTAASLTAATKFAGANYFLPSGGTNTYLTNNPLVPTGTVQSLGGGNYRVGFGGVASPYSDSYATDPFYTTSLTQGMVDRRSPGLSFKAGLGYTTGDKQIALAISEAVYDYDSDYAANRTSEFDADLTYNFNPVRKGTYKGLSFRERYGQRSQPAFPNFPQTFRYLRHQLQYSF